MIDTDIEERTVKQSEVVNVFTDIYEPNVNMTVWNRSLSKSIEDDIEKLVTLSQGLQYVAHIKLSDVHADINKLLIPYSVPNLIGDIVQLVDMFCCLFGRDSVGLRLALLRHAMCPKFHVDHIPCRLVTTYHGAATQWLPHQSVVRTENNILYDSEDICSLNSGDVALLKGEGWHKNTNFGLVHRSPDIFDGKCRLLLTLDSV